MTAELKKVKHAALALPVKDRAQLAKDLLDSLEKMKESEIEQVWIEEACVRAEAYEKGLIKARPAKEFFKSIRERLK